MFYNSLMKWKVIEGARVHGAGRIIGIDINESKQAVGEGFGMTEFINPKNSPDKSISELVKELTGGVGVDYSFECTGIPSMINEALETTKVVCPNAKLRTHNASLVYIAHYASINIMDHLYRG